MYTYDIKNLQDVRNFLSDIPSIHYGGCGVAALAMARWLKKFINKSVNIVFGYNYKFQYDQNNKALSTMKTNNFTSYAHCGISFPFSDEVFDAKKYWIDYAYEYEAILPEFAVVHALNNGGWNNCFDRKVWIPKIEKVLNIDLSDISYN